MDCLRIYQLTVLFHHYSMRFSTSGNQLLNFLFSGNCWPGGSGWHYLFMMFQQKIVFSLTELPQCNMQSLQPRALSNKEQHSANQHPKSGLDFLNMLKWVTTEKNSTYVCLQIMFKLTQNILGAQFVRDFQMELHQYYMDFSKQACIHDSNYYLMSFHTLILDQSKDQLLGVRWYKILVFPGLIR